MEEKKEEKQGNQLLAFWHKIPAPLRRFFINALIIFVVWEALYVLFLGGNRLLDSFLTNMVAEGAALIFSVLGYTVSLVDQGRDGVSLFLDGQETIFVGDPCNGLEITMIFIGFVISTPASYKAKLWFTLLGSFALYVVNSLRVLALGLNHIYFPGSFDFNHKYTYAIVVYSFVVLMWNFWINRYTKNFLVIEGKDDKTTE